MLAKCPSTVFVSSAKLAEKSDPTIAGESQRRKNAPVSDALQPWLRWCFQVGQHESTNARELGHVTGQSKHGQWMAMAWLLKGKRLDKLKGCLLHISSSPSLLLHRHGKMERCFVSWHAINDLAIGLVSWPGLGMIDRLYTGWLSQPRLAQLLIEESQPKPHEGWLNHPLNLFLVVLFCCCFVCWGGGSTEHCLALPAGKNKGMIVVWTISALV